MTVKSSDNEINDAIRCAQRIYGDDLAAFFPLFNELVRERQEQQSPSAISKLIPLR